MRNVWANFRFWAFGVATAGFGVFIARAVAPHFEGNSRLIATLGGQFLALVGLFVICLGVRQRIRRGDRQDLARE